MGVSFTSPGFDKAQGSRAPVKWRLVSQQAVLALAGKGTLPSVLPRDTASPTSGGETGPKQDTVEATGAPTDSSRRVGGAAGSGKARRTGFILAQPLRGSPRWVCSPALVWSSGPLHCAMLGATGTSPDQGGGSWSAMFPRGCQAVWGGLNAYSGRGACRPHQGCGSGASIGALHPQAGTEPRSPASQRGQAGPGRPRSQRGGGGRFPRMECAECGVGTWLRPTTCPSPVHLLGPSVSPS